ncbi:signal transduction histidine kinase [Sphaerotilus hippei]|uniref:histidine kinase n=1 Tax=Sphaerotilus hippei TaxID=744406 RepID=A0A318GWP1_9BURK|nr:hybrid sensor histidine kinase/response regulator [Sphaerotilus hippei]PXW94009.1 signal transduction histidine kinase [Sphaerotilus hippei]
MRHSWPLICFSGFLIVALWAVLLYQVRREADEAIRNAEVNLGNLTRAFSEHTARTLEGADQAIRFVRSEYADQGQSLDIGGYLKQKAIIDSTFHLISIIGPDGFVTKSSQPFQRVDLRDREHFRIHAERAQDRLFVSKPVLGRVSGKWSIQLTRRISPPDGGFGGVVVLSLSPGYLTRFYRDVNLGPHGTITLVGYDGIVRARATGQSDQAAQDVSAGRLFQEAMRHKSGTVRVASHIDQIDRVWAYRALDDYGLLVFTGMGSEDVLAESRQRRMSYLGGAALVTLVIIGFVAGLVRRTRLQDALMRQLQHSKRQAQAANQMKTRFLASVSHELRTPLNGILGYAELLHETSEDAQSRQFGGIIYQSAQHLHHLVNTILDLAKIESGRMTVHPVPVDVPALLRQVHALHAVNAQARGLQLRLDQRPDCPASIRTDGTRLTQVLGNLLGNAIKFTESGSITVSARTDRQDLVIEVRDTGCGIPESVMASVFTRFHATTTAFVHPAQGAGLGLPLAHELTALLGGTLVIEATSAAGTTVVLRLPLSGSPARLEEETA